MTTATTPLDTVHENAKALAEARLQLSQLVRELEAGIEALKADHMPEIRRAVDAASTAWSRLEAIITAHPKLFVKPKKLKAHGITFGYEKGKGSIDIPDAKKTIQLIRKHLPDQAGVLIDIEETPSKAAIAQLSVEQLKKIGAHVTEAGDRVVIRAADTDTDKIMKALIKAAVTEGE